MGVVTKDWRGTPIKVGSVVVYPSRQSSSLWMSQGEVVSISDSKIGVIREGGRRVSYPAQDRLTVVS